MPGPSLKTLFLCFLALSVLGSLALGAIDLGLRNAVTPQGIISFEFCGFAGNCDAALVAWGEAGRMRAMLSMGLDYLYLIAYPGMICTGLLLLAPQLSPGLQGITRLAGGLAPLAGLADACENYALIRILLDGADTGQGQVAGVFAAIKFAIFGATAAWLLLGALVLRPLRRPR